MVPMKVSIITVCYNRVATIGRTIESVLAQDYANIEYIVVDGASTDGTKEVVERYAARLACFISEPDKGMYEALNKGIHRATGDIIGVLHSDEVMPHASIVSTIVKEMEAQGADMLYGDGLFVRDGRVVRDWQGGTFHRWKVRLGWLPLHTTCYVRREVQLRVGDYDERYRIAADTDMLLRLCYDTPLKICYLKAYLVSMEMGGLSTDSRRRKEMWHEDVCIYQRHGMPGNLLKVLKMAWKIPQFIKAKWKRF